MIRKNIVRAATMVAAFSASLAAIQLPNILAPVPPALAGGAAQLTTANLSITSGTYDALPSFMSVKTQRIMGLLGAITAEMAESMGRHAVPGHRASTWLRASYGAVGNSTSGQRWDGNSYLVMLGADYRFNRVFGAGLGLGYSRFEVNTQFNKGQSKENTFSVNPYLLIKTHEKFNFELFGGWSRSDHNDYRKLDDNFSSPATIANPVVVRFRAKPKYDSLYGGIAANFVTKVNKTRFNAQVGYVMMQAKTKKFSETADNALYSFQAGSYKPVTYKKQTVTGRVEAGYRMTPSVMPFLNVHGFYNVKQSTVVSFSKAPKYKDPRSGFGGGGGFQVSNDDALKGSLQFDYTKMDNMSAYVTALRVHYSF